MNQKRNNQHKELNSGFIKWYSRLLYSLLLFGIATIIIKALYWPDGLLDEALHQILDAIMLIIDEKLN